MKYEALAPLYDRLMSHVEYDEWEGLIERVTTKYITSQKPSILELGGGTGVLGSRLSRNGFDYVGSDLSFAMCQQARSRRNLLFSCADARFLPFKKQFDLLLFLYDGINYLQTLSEYGKLFEQAFSCLVPGGLFLFDITTETNSLRHFSDFLDFDDYGDYSFVRHSYYNELTSTQFNDFTIFKQLSNNPSYFEKFTERHEQVVYSVKHIEETIPTDLFEIIGIYDGFTFRKYSLRSERIHFLLRRVK